MADELEPLRDRIADARQALGQGNYDLPEAFVTEMRAVCDELETLDEAESPDSLRVLAHARFRLAQSEDLLDEPGLDTLAERSRNRLLLAVVRILERRGEAMVDAVLPELGDGDVWVRSADYADQIGPLIAQIEQSDEAARQIIDKIENRERAPIVVEGLGSVIKIGSILMAELLAKLISLRWVASLAARLGRLATEIAAGAKRDERVLDEVEGVSPAIERAVSLVRRVRDGALGFLQRVRRAPPGPLVFRDIDEPWCPEMVRIPAGTYFMGSDPDEEGAYDDEAPRHRVTIPEPFLVGRYPVTFEEYDRFVADTGYRQPRDHDWNRGRRPVIDVSWEDAQAYVRWLSERTGQPYRLLSEAEWEYAARAGTTKRYWWGDEASSEMANYGGTVGKTTEVGDYPANPFGLHDMLGNVWELVEDAWHDSYDGAPDDGRAWTEADKELPRVLRGGSWYNEPGDLRAAVRLRNGIVNRDVNVGFRVARTLS